MKKRIAILLFFGFLAHIAFAQSNSYWQQEVNYTIDVALNDSDRTLDGFIRMDYINHSPDTLNYIWIHCWPNAFKNDRTAFSEQLITNKETDFYFADRDKRGYINRLDFQADGQPAAMEDHPLYIDIIKVILPHPLLPGSHVVLTTPFHEKLPYNFSRGGYTTVTKIISRKQNVIQRSTTTSYQLTQWYPKPAVYDHEGWHPMPYLDQGEFYSEFGSFDVHITVPTQLTVAATGQLQNSPLSQELASQTTATNNKTIITPTPTQIKASNTTANKTKTTTTNKTKANPKINPITNPNQNRSLNQDTNQTPGTNHPPTKTLEYKLEKAHDFAWFAAPDFLTQHDTLTLPSGRTIDIYSYYKNTSPEYWGNSISYIKQAVTFRSKLIGEYPYNTVTAVNTGTSGGMEYPTITSIGATTDERDLATTIEHEVGHNWFYGILGTNERRYPWMDEGINTYYDQRFNALYWPDAPKHGLQKKIPADLDKIAIATSEAEKRDQPISTSSEDFTERNYNRIAYSKTGYWLQQLEDSLGAATFDSSMREYYRQWQFKHPYPQDFKKVFTTITHRNLDSTFAQLDKTGPLTPPLHKKTKPAFLFDLRNTDKYSYINFLPALAANEYDKLMIGVLIHNYNFPPSPFHFYAAPMYATGSHQLDGAAGLGYTWYPNHSFRKIDIGLSASRFSTMDGTDSSGSHITGSYYKIVPGIKLTLPKANLKDTREAEIEFKAFLIGEKSLDHYVQKSTDSLYYPTAGKYQFRYINQLSFAFKDNRVLYPYGARLEVQQADEWYRVNFNGNYFFNYATGGGLKLRLFAAKFGYLGSHGANEDLSRYEPKLTAVRGNEDYTYSNYFIGRDEFTGIASQQIMMRDGDLKLRTDIFQDLQGRSDNWVSSMNLESTLPQPLFPSWVPLRLFLDVGTYSGAWQTNPPTSHFLYTGGVELSLLHDIFHFYAPLVYSKDFRDQLKTVPDQNTFGKRLSFSIEIQNLDLKKLFGDLSN